MRDCKHAHVKTNNTRSYSDFAIEGSSYTVPTITKRGKRCVDCKKTWRTYEVSIEDMGKLLENSAEKNKYRGVKEAMHFIIKSLD